MYSTMWVRCHQKSTNHTQNHANQHGSFSQTRHLLFNQPRGGEFWLYILSEQPTKQDSPAPKATQGAEPCPGHALAARTQADTLAHS